MSEAVARTVYPAPIENPLDDVDDRRGRLARMRQHLMAPLPDDRLWGWLGPLLVTAIAAVLRFTRLGNPKGITLDETYYVKGALSLLKFGYERDAIKNADALLATGRTDIFESTGDFVVHPMAGKWIIAAGIQVFGPNAFGWRFAAALLGTLAVFVAARVGRRLFRSTLVGCMAGLLLAVDGTAISMSRIGMLDGILGALLLFAFACLVADRDRAREELAHRMRQCPTDQLGRWRGPGPALGIRPWRVAAGVFLGLALGTKWSALYFVAFFVVLSLLWDCAARRRAGIPRAWAAALRRDTINAVVSLGIVAVVVYLFSWSGWLLTTGGWDRQWASGRSTAWPFIPEALRSLWHYHADMYRFHTGLTTKHPYQSSAWSWLLQGRPTALYFTQSAKCAAGTCTQAITSLGNPALWWASVLALPYLVIEWLGRRDWRAAAILGCVAVGWLPWVLLFGQRTIFSFYTAAFAPFIALAVAYCLGRVLGPAQASERRRHLGAIAVAAYLAVVLAAAAYFLPIWTAESISYSSWLQRQWFRSWI